MRRHLGRIGITCGKSHVSPAQIAGRDVSYRKPLCQIPGSGEWLTSVRQTAPGPGPNRRSWPRATRLLQLEQDIKVRLAAIFWGSPVRRGRGRRRSGRRRILPWAASCPRATGR